MVISTNCRFMFSRSGKYVACSSTCGLAIARHVERFSKLASLSTSTFQSHPGLGEQNSALSICFKCTGVCLQATGRLIA